MKINQTQVNNLNFQSAQTNKPEKAETEQRPQLKEHCSSKAAKALRGIVLGLALTAGVAASSKAMPAKAAEMPVTDNNPTVTQEAETNVAKTDVEMMVDDLMSENNKTELAVGGKQKCSGTMTGDSRNYEFAEISSDGKLTFYDEETKSEYKYAYQMDYDGEYKYCGKMEYTTEYNKVNAFNLGVKAEDGMINLQKGAQFKEQKETNGDYIELAEDGKTFNVFDSEGKQIGSCAFKTKEDIAKAEESLATIGKVGLGVLGGAGVIAAGSIIASNKKGKEE